MSFTLTVPGNNYLEVTNTGPSVMCKGAFVPAEDTLYCLDRTETIDRLETGHGHEGGVGITQSAPGKVVS